MYAAECLVQRAAEQVLAADGAIACFSSSFLIRSSDADRAPQMRTAFGVSVGVHLRKVEHCEPILFRPGFLRGFI